MAVSRRCHEFSTQSVANTAWAAATLELLEAFKSLFGAEWQVELMDGLAFRAQLKLLEFKAQAPCSKIRKKVILYNCDRSW